MAASGDDDLYSPALRPPSALRTLAAGAVVVGIAAPIARHRLRLPRAAVSLLSWQAPVTFALATRPSRPRDGLVYLLQMWAYFAHYEMPNDDPERLRQRLKIDYPIRVDRLIGCGELPSARLQRRFARPGTVGIHDVGLSSVHWAWFLVPHGSLAYILVRHPERFRRSACLIAAVFDSGLVFYWALPTAPPWWATANGRATPVRRIMTEAGERLWGPLWRPLYDSLGGNPFAAMPSLHFATSLMAAQLLSEVGTGPGALGWTYAAALGGGLVYLGEHYVIDLVAGAALARAVFAARRPAESMARALADAIDRLEPAFG